MPRLQRNQHLWGLCNIDILCTQASSFSLFHFCKNRNSKLRPWKDDLSTIMGPFPSFTIIITFKVLLSILYFLWLSAKEYLISIIFQNGEFSWQPSYLPQVNFKNPFLLPWKSWNYPFWFCSLNFDWATFLNPLTLVNSYTSKLQF